MADSVPDKSMPLHRAVLGWGVGYGLLLLIAALASPQLDFENGSSPLFWLPVGVALGALLRQGWKVLPGLFLALPASYLLAGLSSQSALTLSLLDGAVLLLTNTLLRLASFDPFLRQRRDGWLLLGLGILLGGFLIGLGHRLLTAAIPDNFAAPIYAAPLGMLLGSLPVLSYSTHKLRQLAWRQALRDWIPAWALPITVLCWAILTEPGGLPVELVSVLGLLWMIWFVLDRGLGSAVLALLMNALLLGWLLALQPQPQPMLVEHVWALLFAMGGLACAVSPLLAELRNRDQRVRLALDGTQTGIWDWNLKTDRLLLSPGWLQRQGYPEAPAGLPLVSWEKMIHPDDLPACRESLRQHLEGETPLFRKEFRLQTQDDTPHWLLVRGRITERNCQGKPLRLLGTLVDISGQKSTQRYLQVLERALHSARDAVAILDMHSPGQPVLFTNPALEKITGYRAEQILGLPMLFFSPEGDETAASTLILNALMSGRASHGLQRVQRQDGSSFWSQLSISPVRDEQGAISHCIAIFSDVSAEVRAREHLKERDELLQKLSEQVPGLIFQYRVPPQGTAVCPYTSNGLKSLFGLEPETLKQSTKAFFATLHPHDRPRVEATLNGHQAALQPWRDEFRVMLNGQEYWREGHAIPELQPNGDILWHGYIKDITRQMQLVMALGESEARFRAIANATPMLIWQADKAGQCSWFNQAWFDFTGQRASLQFKHSWLDYVHPEDQPGCRALVARQTLQHLPFRLQCRIQHQNGQWRWIINQGVPRQNDSGEFMGYIGAGMDIDEQKRVELALRQSQEELRRMGLREELVLEQERKRIASQVHDELGQLLTALKMGISSLRLRFKEVPGLAEQVYNLNELSTRAFQVVRQVTTHLRPQALNHGLRPALEWLAQETTQNTGLSVHADCPEMRCQPSDAINTALFRLAQEGVTNVLKHARARRAEINLSCKDSCLILIVCDDGIGFQSDSLATTGYGLLGMRERAQNLGGEFRITSACGQGTTLFLSIPVEQLHDCHTCHCCR